MLAHLSVAFAQSVLLFSASRLLFEANTVPISSFAQAFSINPIVCLLHVNRGWLGRHEKSFLGAPDDYVRICSGTCAAAN